MSFMAKKMAKPAKVEHLANWFFGNFCVRCARIDDERENYGKDCYDKIHTISDILKADGIGMMTHKEFCIIVKSSLFCKQIKRVFKECKIRKALGVPQRRF